MSSYYEEDESEDIHDVMVKPIESYNIERDNKIFYADEVPLPEMSFEIESEDEINNTCDDDTSMCLETLEHASRVDKLISPIPPHCDFDDLKSPLNTFSDCGYSSQGSPNSIHDYPVSDIISDDFLDIFPVLEGLN
jgi:hypothetical protein